MNTKAAPRPSRRTLATSLLALFTSVCVLGFSGCVTDRLAVFKKQILSKKAMQAHVGPYDVETWPGNDKARDFRVIAEDKKYFFAYEQDRAYKLEFLVSKVPGSNQGVHLISLPKQKETEEPMFFLAAKEEGKTRIWMVLDNQPVVKGNLKSVKHRFKADDVLDFLKKNADEYVIANKPEVVLVKKTKK